jgi:DNA-binding PadR family transcriptional regulator
MWFREENKWNYRKRYALTQEGRRIVEEWIAITSGQMKVDLEYDYRAVNTEIKDRADGIPTKLLGRKLKGHEDTPLAKKIIERAKTDGRDISGILPPSKPRRGE